MQISTGVKFTIILALHCYLPGLAGAAEPASSTWQMTRLFQPTQANLNRAAKGRIMIYDGLTDKTVETALDEQCDRVETMIFKVVVTDDSGEPKRDMDTGEIITEEDGCD